ncbi:MAG TPA: 4Fe-4S dicluster domain-containing protein [Candidatus Acetothermia bacterium]|nr:4Fe-4S dicluster domain-containing protein [Candidatus Acetothermia bacterium]
MLKTTAGICAFDSSEPSPYRRSLPCIRCGYCNLVCPVGIYPVLIMEAEKNGQTKRLGRLHAEDCIDCGLCSYVCPSAIKLTEHLRRAAGAVRRSRAST